MDNLLAELPDPDLDFSEEDTRALVDDPPADGSHPVTTRKASAASATCIHVFACLLIIKDLASIRNFANPRYFCVIFASADALAVELVKFWMVTVTLCTMFEPKTFPV